MSTRESTFQYKRVSHWNPTCCCVFSHLPDDVMVHYIFSSVSMKDLFVTSAVCRRWACLSHNRVLWRHLDLSSVVKWGISAQKTRLVIQFILRRHFRKAYRLKLCGLDQFTSHMMDFFHIRINSPQNGSVEEETSSTSSSDSTVSQPTMTRVSSNHSSSSSDDGAEWTNIRLFANTMGTGLLGTHIREIHFCNLVQLRDEIVAIVVQICPQLSHIEIPGCLSLQTQSLVALSSSPSLRKINMSRCLFSDEDMTTFFSSSHIQGNLTDIQLNDCPYVSHQTVQSIAQFCWNALSIKLRAVDVNHDDVVALVDGCPLLNQLDLGSDNMFFGNSAITDDTVLKLCTMGELHCVNLEGSSAISDYSVCNLLRFMPLYGINLSGCSQLTDNIARALYDRYHKSVTTDPIAKCSGIQKDIGLKEEEVSDEVMMPHIHSEPNLAGIVNRSSRMSLLKSYSRPPTPTRPRLMSRLSLPMVPQSLDDEDDLPTSKIRTLKLSNLNISDEAIGLLSTLPIRLLDVNECRALTNDCVCYFEHGFKCLESVDLGLCSGLTRERVDEFSRKRPEVKIKFY